MKKRFLAGIISAAMVTLGAMSAFANAGIGLDADPDATCDWNPHKIICLEELQLKEYIDDKDKVIGTLPAGAIVETHNNIFRKGVDTGWSDAELPVRGMGFFDRNNAQTQKYDPKTPVEIEIDDDSKVLTVRLPEDPDETYEYTVSDPEKIDALTSEDTDGGQFVISFRIVSEKDKDDFDVFPDGSIHFVGKINGEKAHDFTINIIGGEVAYEAWAIEKPLDFSEIKDLIDRTEVKYLADGSTVKVYVLKDGRMIDMNGFECVGVADDASQMHDGTVIYDQQVSK